MFELFEQGVSALQDIAKALHDTDRTNIVLVGATIALALATIIFGVLDRRRQNNERFERVRPWITITEPVPLQVIFQNGQAMEWKRFLEIQPSLPIPDKVRIGSYFTNTGIRPAHKLKKIGFGQDAPITRVAVEQKREDDLNMDMGPNQSHYHFYEIPWQFYNETNTQPIYFVLRISYDNGRYRSYSGIIYEFTRTMSRVITVWYI